MRSTILLMLFAIVLLVVACDSEGGEESLRLEAYVVAASCLTEEAALAASDVLDVVNTRTGEGETPEPTSAQSLRDVNLAFWDEFATLDPPDEIDGAHEQLVDAGRESARTLVTERPAGLSEAEARFEEARVRIAEVVEETGFEYGFLSGAACEASRTPTP